jgi:hypothetical protein
LASAGSTLVLSSGFMRDIHGSGARLAETERARRVAGSHCRTGGGEVGGGHCNGAVSASASSSRVDSVVGQPTSELLLRTRMPWQSPASHASSLRCTHALAMSLLSPDPLMSSTTVGRQCRNAVNLVAARLVESVARHGLATPNWRRDASVGRA